MAYTASFLCLFFISGLPTRLFFLIVSEARERVPPCMPSTKNSAGWVRLKHPHISANVQDIFPTYASGHEDILQVSPLGSLFLRQFTIKEIITVQKSSMATNSAHFSLTNQIIYFPYHNLILCLCPVHQTHLWSVACGAEEEGREPVMATNITTTNQYYYPACCCHFK